jgi:hypothetical protein
MHKKSSRMRAGMKCRAHSELGRRIGQRPKAGLQNNFNLDVRALFHTAAQRGYCIRRADFLLNRRVQAAAPANNTITQAQIP